jgi:DNA replicative helicase MCM subunit Mcm2 (Cdc46/Mcm family)
MQLQKVLGIIGEMERVSGVVQDEDLFTAMLEDHGIARSEVARLIGVLMRDGTIYSPRPGYYKRTS